MELYVSMLNNCSYTLQVTATRSKSSRWVKPRPQAPSKRLGAGYRQAADHRDSRSSRQTRGARDDQARHRRRMPDGQYPVNRLITKRTKNVRAGIRKIIDQLAIPLV